MYTCLKSTIFKKLLHSFNLKKIYKIYRYLDISLEILKLAIVILNGN